MTASHLLREVYLRVAASHPLQEVRLQAEAIRLHRRFRVRELLEQPHDTDADVCVLVRQEAQEGPHWTLECPEELQQTDDPDADALFTAASDLGTHICHLERQRSTLEQVFLRAIDKQLESTGEAQQ